MASLKGLWSITFMGRKGERWDKGEGSFAWLGAEVEKGDEEGIGVKRGEGWEGLDRTN